MIYMGVDVLICCQLLFSTFCTLIRPCLYVYEIKGIALLIHCQQHMSALNNFTHPASACMCEEGQQWICSFILFFFELVVDVGSCMYYSLFFMCIHERPYTCEKKKRGVFSEPTMFIVFGCRQVLRPSGLVDAFYTPHRYDVSIIMPCMWNVIKSPFG